MDVAAEEVRPAIPYGRHVPGSSAADLPATGRARSASAVPAQPLVTRPPEIEPVSAHFGSRWLLRALKRALKLQTLDLGLDGCELGEEGIVLGFECGGLRFVRCPFGRVGNLLRAIGVSLRFLGRP